MKATRRGCELCNGEAALHCEPDSAFLCWACDARVHAANFLVARHPRRLLCLQCGAADPRHPPVSGPAFLPAPFLCRSCNGDDDDGTGSSPSDSDSSSSCVSSAESGAAASARGTAVAFEPVARGGDGPIKARRSVSSANPACRPVRRQRQRRRRVDARTEGVLLSWCRRVGLDGARALGAASHALAVGARRMAAAVPLRVVVAASVWSAARLCGAEPAVLGRLEACSGVPARLIVAAEARLSGDLRLARRARARPSALLDTTGGSDV